MLQHDHHPTASPSIIPAILVTKEMIITKKVKFFRDHYDVKDREGNKLAQVEEEIIQTPSIFQIKDSKTETVILEIEERTLTGQYAFRDDMGAELGVIRMAINPEAHDYVVESDGNQIMRIYGNFVGKEYCMEASDQLVARVHRDRVLANNEYGISILGDIDHRLVVGASIAIDYMESRESMESL